MWLPVVEGVRIRRHVTEDEACAIHAQLVVPWLREMAQQGGLVIED